MWNRRKQIPPALPHGASAVSDPHIRQNSNIQSLPARQASARSAALLQTRKSDAAFSFFSFSSWLTYTLLHIYFGNIHHTFYLFWTVYANYLFIKILLFSLFHIFPQKICSCGRQCFQQSKCFLLSAVICQNHSTLTVSIAQNT